MRTKVNGSHRVIRDAWLEAKAYRDSESGSLTIFSLFLFILILFITGMAVDVMRYESERTSIQNTIDTAIIAASSLSQTASTDAEIQALVKDYVSKAGYDPDMVNVTPVIEFPEGGSVAIGRSVSANVDFRLDTIFMNMMGIDHLEGQTKGAAREGQQLIEIALVLDMSGSMGDNGKMDNLKVAAKDFVTTVLTASGPDRVSISIVPYNQQVYMDDDLMARLAFDDATIVTASAYGLGLSVYQRNDATSRCARFSDADFATRRLAAGNVDTTAVFKSGGNSNTKPDESAYWCGDARPKMFLYQNDETKLHDFIDALSAGGYTAIDYGMNWGVGILDPSFQPVISSMVDSGVLVDTMRGHPVDYDETEVVKYVVLMTDGQNTDHLDLAEPFKSGPSPVWYSETLANGTKANGFLVERSNGPASSRFYRPRSTSTTNDDQFLSEASLPIDAEQYDYHKLYREYAVRDVARMFFQHSGDTAAYNAHWNAVIDAGSYGAADTRVRSICSAAAANEEIEVFTVAFEAPTNAETLLRDCASKPGNYFDVDGTQISDAFSAIAAQISQLRLTQ